MRSLFAGLNPWIGFAKVWVRHPQGDRYRSAYEQIQEQVRSGTLMLPLSATHYQEISDIGSLRQSASVVDRAGRRLRSIAVEKPHPDPALALIHSGRPDFDSSSLSRVDGLADGLKGTGGCGCGTVF